MQETFMDKDMEVLLYLRNNCGGETLHSVVLVLSLPLAWNELGTAACSGAGTGAAE